MKNGTIFDIKEFAIFDGPGIRQTVFFKGCPLRCNWCHNPEGLRIEPEMMVSYGSCIHCGACTAICPSTSSCQLCGACIPVCPFNLRHIVGETLTSDQLVTRIRQNSAYYSKAAGGVTFSGGEPLMQADFLLEVLEKLPDLHKAIETSGCCKPEIFKNIIRSLDFVIMDLKIFDSELHKKYTGADNRVILENARQLCQGNTPFIIRIPVIPGVNDNEENYRQTAQFLQGAPALQKVELLPYHKTAGAKYSMLDKTYAPMFDPEKEPWISTDIFTEYNIRSERL